MVIDKNKKENIPNHVGIIMDGNRRWAVERNLPTLEGHYKGYEKSKHATDWFFARGVKVLSLYAFSIENWTRSREEVNYLMKLLKLAIDEQAESMMRKGYKVIFSGRIDELPGDLPEACSNLESKTKANAKGLLHICINYGGRAEIVDAVKKIVKHKIELDQVHEGMIGKYMYQPALPDVDLMIRTSGEQRTSGFLLWQSHYSEMIFMKKYWPEFEESDVDNILAEYVDRKRRFGGDQKLLD
jgi:undecaprenyl diphosphate synthase